MFYRNWNVARCGDTDIVVLGSINNLVSEEVLGVLF